MNKNKDGDKKKFHTKLPRLILKPTFTNSVIENIENACITLLGSKELNHRGIFSFIISFHNLITSENGDSKEALYKWIKENDTYRVTKYVPENRSGYDTYGKLSDFTSMLAERFDEVIIEPWKNLENKMVQLETKLHILEIRNCIFEIHEDTKHIFEYIVDSRKMTVDIVKDVENEGKSSAKIRDDQITKLVEKGELRNVDRDGQQF